MNFKRGQELSITTLVLIALGIIVLVLIVLGFWKGWGFVFGKFDLIPGQNLEAVAQGCVISAQGKLNIDFCSFKKLSNTEYVSCLDPRIAPYYAQNNVAALSCSSPYTKEEQCKKLETGSSDVTKISVNSVACTKTTTSQTPPSQPATSGQ